VNEYDLVTRADRAYVLSLVALYCSANEAVPQSHHHPEETLDSGDTPNIYWQLPASGLTHIGKRVILKLALQDLSADNCDQVGEELALSTWQVSAEDFLHLLFCKVAVHSRVVYQERIKQLAEGRFNGRHRW
jgi:hypothetical protein